MMKSPVLKYRSYWPVALIIISLTPFIFSFHLASGQDGKPCQPDSTLINKLNSPCYHLELADSYRKKADQCRQDALEHRQKFEAYKKSFPLNPKDRSENLVLKKAGLEEEAFERDKEQLAAEADKMAAYHIFRARELKGE